MNRIFAKRSGVAWLVRAASTLVLVAGLAGCSSSSSSSGEGDASSSQQFVIARGEPRDRLRQIFARYRGSSFYRDSSEVVLRIVPADSSMATPPADPMVAELLAGGNQTQRAPFRVRWTGKQLDVQAYSVRMRVDASQDSGPVELNAWFDEPETRHFDSQMLVDRWQKPKSQRIDLDRVMRDEVLRSKLSAGLAGPPPQLEWLFAGDPMSGIFEPSAELKWLEDDVFAGQKMRRIAAQTEGKSYVFWIDPTASVIRRVELPLPPVDGLDRSRSSLTLEFREASFAPPANEEDAFEFDFQPPFRAQRVTQFVPVPPPPPSSLLGRRMPNDTMRTLTGTGDNSRVVLFRLSEDEDANIREPHWIASAVMRARQANLAGVHWAATTADESLQRELAKAWTGAVTVMSDRSLRDAFGLLRLGPGGIALIDSDQTVLLTERRINASSVGNVLAALADDSAGVDVPAKIQSDYEQLQRSYEAALAKVLQP
ncbi:hypothetical protein [Rhodopirellula halodulae]|uniref:hypothetical protein n=1 Tax=Rhodopirellula halodulae TaxID=2894198 RepID=UPI001E579E55|nr:hypothetical protein [Rhodopirellula sp. JC737]MCC9656918.1 hypothetical protein [Rhodopirellula sp. JC737]